MAFSILSILLILSVKRAMDDPGFTHDVFLNHSAKDTAVVQPLVQRLQSAVRQHRKVRFDEWECPSPAEAGEGCRRPGESRGVAGSPAMMANS